MASIAQCNPSTPPCTVIASPLHYFPITSLLETPIAQQPISSSSTPKGQVYKGKLGELWHDRYNPAASHRRSSGAVNPGSAFVRPNGEPRHSHGGRRRNGDRGVRISLPPELLTHVFAMMFEPRTSTSKEQAIRTLNSSIQTLGRCCLVSYSWYTVARSILYTRRLALCNTKKARLLLRTLQENTADPYPVRHLYFSYHNPYDAAGEQDFARSVTHIVSLCPQLWYLEAEWGPLEFTFLIALPMFQSLEFLRVTSQYLDLLAPLLPHLPNLTRLTIVYLIGNSSRPGREMRRLDPPTFRLRTLELSQADLSPAQYQWLLSSSSHSLEYLELQELARSAELVGKTVGRAVKSLHVKSPVDHLRRGDPDLVDALPHFPKLRNLRVSGLGWQWNNILVNIAADLRSLAVTFSNEAAEMLIVALANPRWQPELRSLTVFYSKEVGGNPELLRTLDARLEQMCAKRSIQLFRAIGS